MPDIYLKTLSNACLRKQFYDTFHLIEHAFQIDLPSFKMAKKTMKVLRGDSQIDFVTRTSGTRTSHGRLGGGGFVLGVSLSPINIAKFAIILILLPHSLRSAKASTGLSLPATHS